MNVKIIAQENCYQGFFSLTKLTLSYELFKGGFCQPVSRECLQHRGAVGILPYDPVLQKIVLVEQFRIGVVNSERQPWLMELVAGLIEENETNENVAKREAEEEAGLAVAEIVPICDYWTSPGCSTERIWLFCGKVDSTLAKDYAGLASEGEDIKVHVLDVGDVLTLLNENYFKNAPTIIALQWFHAHHSIIFQ